jgi:hypothetical protein
MSATARAWLEERRQELLGQGTEVPRPSLGEDREHKDPTEHQLAIQALIERLTADVAVDVEERTPEQQARWVLAYLLEWHWREEKSGWWEYFRLAELTSERIISEGPISGSGLRYLPVPHSGNNSLSSEEAEAVAQVVIDILASNAIWVDRSGKQHKLTLEDILVITPYNAQVSEIKKRLPQARVGTVDKFQGQEAPIAIYSMATSSHADAPRGMEFLYSGNRLNVAISRAQCIALLVASPDVFEADCKTPRQMQLANAFCRYLELVAPDQG